MDQPTLVTCSLPTGVAGRCSGTMSIPENSGDEKHDMADDDLEALSLTELKKNQKDIAMAIFTCEDRQTEEICTKV